MIKDFALSLFLLTFFLFFLTRFFYWFRTDTELNLRKKLILGAVCGLLGILLLYNGVSYNGFMFDVRSVALLLAVSFGGLTSSLTALVIITIPRVLMDVAALPRVLMVGILICLASSYFYTRAKGHWRRWLLISMTNCVILGTYSSIYHMPFYHYTLPYSAANIIATIVVAGYQEFLLRTYNLMSGMNKLRKDTSQMLRMQPGLTFKYIRLDDGSFLHTMAEGLFFESVQLTNDYLLQKPFTPEMMRPGTVAAYEQAWAGEEAVFQSDLMGRDIMVFLKPVKSEQGIIVEVIGTFIDITEKVVAEREAAQNERRRLEADAASEAKTKFLAKMSHEIRTPLNGIVGLSQLLQKTSLTSQQAGYLNGMQSSSRILMGIINDILDFSKVESEKLELHLDAFRIRSWADRLTETLNVLVGSKPIEVRVIIDEQCPALVQADELRLEQIMLNLCSNAIKFTERGFVEIKVELLAMDPIRQEAKLRFSVQDTGIGMQEEHLESLFQPFKQGSPAIARVYGGTGLGLVISEQLLALMGSSLQVESEYGRGSRFTFELNCSVVEESLAIMMEEFATASASVAASVVASEEVTVQSGYLLVAEDNEINQIIVREILESCGYKVDIAADGVQTLEMLAARSYDLILMDVHMPQMDGIEATKRIREQACYQNVPIIAVTANVMESDHRRYLAVGMNGILTKPYDDKMMIQMIAEHLNKS
ncbi:response regulator [Paenibacillus albus]|uniref:Circadian input-output histidine kinase CikA n=1 Tax=Paenibacillus albus TaxID=2495582 RepID=A0A3S9A9C5_9BACL|nr:response regulator [Paenibacillus albus]AZN42379.1 response regulator [Paenibacillus albus]